MNHSMAEMAGVGEMAEMAEMGEMAEKAEVREMGKLKSREGASLV